jgi:hypothetical protein
MNRNTNQLKRKTYEASDRSGGGIGYKQKRTGADEIGG